MKKIYIAVIHQPVLRIRDKHPGSWFLHTHPGSRISDPGSKKSNKRRGGENSLLLIFFFCNHKFHKKLNIILFLKCWRKKFGPIFKELLKFLPKKFSLCSQIYGFGIRDPGSGKNLFRIPDPGVKGHRIRIRNTATSHEIYYQKFSKHLSFLQHRSSSTLI